MFELNNFLYLYGNSHFSQIFQILSYLGSSIGLYLINKNLGEKHPWLSFIPLINIYSFVKAAGKDGIWILWLFLGYICLIIPGLIITIILCYGISKRTGGGIWRTIGILLFSFIVLPIVGFNMNNKITKNNDLNEKNDIYV